MTHEVLILGAGPAGSLVARQLAAAGIRVALVGGASRPGWEGLSARSVALLAAEGLDAAADGLVAGPHARGGEWAGGRAVTGREWLVERRALAGFLRARARAAGADARVDTVLGVRFEGGLWRGRLRSGGMLAAPWLIDARGRRGAERRGPLLLALGQSYRWRRSAGGAVRPATHVQAADWGWCWWAVHREGLWVQVVGRPHASDTLRHPAAWLSAAACLPPLAGLLAHAVADAAAVARPAHARLGLCPAGQSYWRVGDAALALDPLSGQGVYESLRGARLVATALGSVLGGGDAAAAHRFVRERQEEAWTRGVRVAAGFYREYAARSAFWADTADAYERLLPPELPVAPHVARRPVLCGGRIVEKDVLVTARHPRGVWQVAEVPVVELQGYLAAVRPASLHGAAAALGKPPQAVAAAMQWLQQTGGAAAVARTGSSGG